MTSLTNGSQRAGSTDRNVSDPAVTAKPGSKSRETVLAMQGVTFAPGGTVILRDMTLEVSQGETLVILGPSGCGKSVTMKVLMQLLHQHAGSVCWFGRSVADLSPSEFRDARLNLGYLFQGAALFDSLSVYENIAFGLRETTRQSETEIRETVLNRLGDVGLGPETASRRPSEISGGMQKRVGIARALALQPQVMFYDEPTTGLDPISSRRIDSLIAEVGQSLGVTSIIVTHDLRTVERVAERIMMLAPVSSLNEHENQIVFDGSPEELRSSTDARVTEYLAGELTGTVKRTTADHGRAAA